MLALYKEKIINLIKPFRTIIMMSLGYIFAVGAILIMYTLLPVIFTDLWGSSVAGIVIMLMTMAQIFIF